MIRIENGEVVGLEHAIRGMRNPMNSWDRSDSHWGFIEGAGEGSFKVGREVRYIIEENDKELMTKLANGGPVHAKYRRMITVYCDVTAPLYWWKEFDTYKVGTVANSCSTMHKIHEKEFTLDDFSHEHLTEFIPGQELHGFTLEENDLIPLPNDPSYGYSSIGILKNIIIKALNFNRDKFLETGDKKYWWQMIQLLPSSYNQKRTIMLNYEVLANIYKWRKEHKLDEWREFCKWIDSLPYSEIITMEK